MLVVLQRKVHEMSDPGGVHVLQLVVFAGVYHRPLVEVPISSSKRLTPNIGPLVWILTMVGTSSPSPSTPLPCLWWLACCSGVAYVPILTSGLRLLARRGRHLLLLLLSTRFSRGSDVEPEHKWSLVRDAHPTIERYPLTLDTVFVASGLFNDNGVSGAVSATSCRCPLKVASLLFKHDHRYLFLLSDLGRLCCTTSGEDVLAVLVSLLQLPQTHIA